MQQRVEVETGVRIRRDGDEQAPSSMAQSPRALRWAMPPTACRIVGTTCTVMSQPELRLAQRQQLVGNTWRPGHQADCGVLEDLLRAMDLARAAAAEGGAVVWGFEARSNARGRMRGRRKREQKRMLDVVRGNHTADGIGTLEGTTHGHER